jgi:hypothetical protein
MSETTYKIIKFVKDSSGFPTRSQRAIKRGLTLEEAQEHCQREDTRGQNWFHGYTEE